MTALPGTLDEWEEVEPRRWRRRDHPEDGTVTIREGMSFKDYFAKRAEPESPPPPDARDVKIADLEARIARLEQAGDVKAIRG